MIRESISMMKNGKGVGPSGVVPEMINSGEDIRYSRSSYSSRMGT